MAKHRPQWAAPYPKEPKPGPGFATGAVEQLNNFKNNFHTCFPSVLI